MATSWNLALCSCAALLLAGCGLTVQGTSTDNTDPAAEALDEALLQEVRIPVEAVHPSRSDVFSFFETTARVVAERRVDVVAEGVGQCTDLRVEEGDRVKAGQVLAELEKETLLAQMAQTRVSIDQNRSAYERARKGLAGGIGAPVELENARFALEQAEASLKLQEIQLKNLTITAPIDGVVTQRNIQPGMMVTSGIPAFTIVDPTSFVLPIFVPERQLGRLQPGQEAQVRLDAGGDAPLIAKVDRINPSVDPMSGTVKVNLVFEGDTAGVLREAAFARVKLIMDRRDNVLVVPKDAVVQENTRDYLMVVQEQVPEGGGAPVLVAERVEVETGLEDSENIEIVRGVGADSLVVTLGQHTLKSGSVVTVTNSEAEVARNAGLTVDEGLALAEARKQQKEAEEEAAKAAAESKAEAEE